MPGIPVGDLGRSFTCFLLCFTGATKVLLWDESVSILREAAISIWLYEDCDVKIDGEDNLRV
jgi:hypothetical protein